MGLLYKVMFVSAFFRILKEIIISPPWFNVTSKVKLNRVKAIYLDIVQLQGVALLKYEFAHTSK